MKPQKEIKVGDSFRTNDLSRQPGGSVVRVVYSDGPDRIYDKVKSVEQYTASLKKRANIAEIHVNGSLYWKK